MWSAGQTIGNYELVANLRSGGMATLFIARRRGVAGFTRPVAIKVVHPELSADEQFRQMFLDEAMLSSRIQHPNVVHVEELGEHAGVHFLVMEFVHGCSLAQLLRALHGLGRRLSPPFAVRIAMHVAEGLQAAHEARDEQGHPLAVVHRDVSPENILLAYAGHVKLIDFGIAKAYGRRHRTQEGLLKGKFRYMAPEQAYAKPVDRRTDIYQLGIVLWEMLTQRRLFDAETDVDLLAQVRSPHIVPPSALVERIPSALDAAVMSALASSPAQRPKDAQAFARLLARAVPQAFDVDSGALSALLEHAMQEHRRRERATFPRGVYEQLDQQVQTLPMGGAGAEGPLARATLENHTARLPGAGPLPGGGVEAGGAEPHPSTREQNTAAEAAAGPLSASRAEPSASPRTGATPSPAASPTAGAASISTAPFAPIGARAEPAAATAVRSAAWNSVPEVGAYAANPSGTQPGFASPGRGASERVRMPAGAMKAPVAARRGRRLVRIASEIRTTITRIVEADLHGSRALWLSLGAGLGLLCALLFIALAGHPRRHGAPLPPPPSPSGPAAAFVAPSLPAPVSAPSLPAPVSAPSAPPGPSAGTRPPLARPAATDTAQVPPPGATEHNPDGAARKRAPRRASGPVTIQGTPLFVEPGF